MRFRTLCVFMEPQASPPPTPARKGNLLRIAVAVAIALSGISLAYTVVSQVQDRAAADQTRAQLDGMRNTLAADNGSLASLEAAEVSASSTYVASGCGFVYPQLFDISVTYANFGTVSALDTTFTVTVYWSGGSQIFTYAVGTVAGRQLGSFVKEYQLNSCSTVTSVYISWTWS